ncbi:MAG TPA: M28 family peptidase, partial [Candidatus Eisenbacteria bacterium]|nr:M28 family peptidase [Candidatus Eisenbacteria bacterium]
AGMILVDAHADDERGELVPIGSSLWRSENRIVAAQVKRSVVDRWLAPYGVSVAALRERIDRFEKPGSMPLPGASISLTVTLEAVRRRTANVIAVAPGYDAKHSGEAIVIGAHYDHIGRGQFGARDSSSTGQIHYGADDNASGVAVLLELARRLGAVKLPRAVVLAAFSAEELGLFGSRHYVNRPAFPLDKTRAMINLDMVGRLRGNRVTVFGTGSARTFPAIVLDAARPLGLEVRQSDGIGRSDHMSFYARRIPVLHFFTGLHEDYHRPTDTWEKLNLDGMAKITDLVFAVAERIAATRDPLEFVSVPGAASGIDVGGFNVYLGTIPDYESSLPGVRLAGVAGGSPAALAGLREGDVIVGFAGSEVRTIDDLTVQLQGRMPGEEVEIAVLRQSQPVSVKAVLSTRP